MRFVDFVRVLGRHKPMVVLGLIGAVLLALFSAYRLEGSTLVERSMPYYETTAVVAMRPGPEQSPPPTTVPPTTTAPPTTIASSDPAAAGLAPTTVASTVATPPLAPLNDVIDSRGLYYTALSIKTVVVSPGFAEAVRARAPTMDGSITAVVAQDTNTIDVVANGSTPMVAAETMSAALAEIHSVIRSYATTPATRFGLEGVVVSAPSTPKPATSIKGPLTMALVFVVTLLMWWFVIRAIDAVQLHKRRLRRRRQSGAAPGPPPESNTWFPAPVGNGQHPEHEPVAAP